MNLVFLRYLLPLLFAALGVACLSLGQSADQGTKNNSESVDPKESSLPMGQRNSLLGGLGGLGSLNTDNSLANHLFKRNMQSAASAQLESIANAMLQAKNNKDESALTKLNRELETAVTDQFDALHKEREQELDRLEKTLASLRAMQAKRLSQRDQIVAEKIAQVKREVDGLGWISPTTSGVLRERLPAKE